MSFTCPLTAAAPRFSPPLRHFALAAASFWAFAAALFAGRNALMGFGLDARWALGATHLLTLGFLSVTMLGAMSQMLPAHGGAALRRPWAPALGLWLLAAGLAVFVAELWLGARVYWRGPALAAAALACYLSSYVPTLLASPELPFTEKHFAAALAFLVSLAGVGVLLAVDRSRGALLPAPDHALIAHVHLALVGWVSLAIIGASYRLFHPVALSRGANRLPSQAAFALLAAGTAGLAADALLGGNRWPRVWALTLAAGYACYLTQLRSLAKAKLRLDPPMAFTLVGILGGIVWAGLGLALAFGLLEDRWEARAAYGLCALLGWATPWVLGQAHKIFPFLVWRSVYAESVDGPSFDALGRPALAWTALATLALGWPLCVAGLLRECQPALTAGLSLVLACATAYALQSALWLSHLPWPRFSES
ncbi:MAG: hypothetical protein HYZ75_03565 [Elusimicrobia bacterium]|nr:hypothetical protein [Elusimicrobiota bacterium]